MTEEPIADTPPSLLPVIVGFLLAGVALLVLGFWVANREPVDTTPTLRLLSPARDTATAGPITLHFSTDRELTLQPTGWGSGRYHVHVLVGAVELMPGPSDIRPTGERTYAWSIPAVEDTATVQLVWSLPNHSRLPRGASNAIRITGQ